MFGGRRLHCHWLLWKWLETHLLAARGCSVINRVFHHFVVTKCSGRQDAWSGGAITKMAKDSHSSIWSAQISELVLFSWLVMNDYYSWSFPWLVNSYHSNESHSVGYNPMIGRDGYTFRGYVLAVVVGNAFREVLACCLQPHLWGV